MNYKCISLLIFYALCTSSLKAQNPGFDLLGLIRGECQIRPRESLSAIEQINQQINHALENRVWCQQDGCRYSKAPVCNGKRPSWGPMQIGADLAERIVEQEMTNKSEQLAARVAVIDSGFDWENRKDAMNALSLQTLPGHAAVGDINIDESGHGSAVSSMIAGRDTGMTSHIHLDIYRVTPPGDEGSIKSKMLGQAILRACETADVVNVSWGGLLDEVGFLSHYQYSDWYQKAKEKGCLVVRAAGNMGVKKGDHLDVGIEEPFITVAANNQIGREANFSTQALLTAPGQNVFVYKSEQSAQNPENERQHQDDCLVEGQRLGLINGTSFSAPAVSGVAAQVVTVLRARGKLPAQANKKIALVKKILLASQKVPKSYAPEHQSVNALAAVLMAQAIGDGNKDYTQGDLLNIVDEETQNLCQESFSHCHLQSECQQRLDCIDQLRKQVMLCAPQLETGMGIPFNEQSYQDYQRYLERYHYLYSGLMCFRETELALHVIQRAPSTFFHEPDSRHVHHPDVIVKELWQQNIGERGIINASMAMDIIELSEATDSSYLNYEKMLAILKSSDMHINGRLGARDAESKLHSGRNQQLERFARLITHLDIDDYERIVKRLPYLADRLSLSDSELMILYYLYQSRDRLSEQKKSILQDRLNTISARWLEGRLRKGLAFFSSLDDPHSSTNKILAEIIKQWHEREVKIDELLEDPHAKKHQDDLFYVLLTESSVTASQLEKLALDTITFDGAEDRSFFLAVEILADKDEHHQVIRDQFVAQLHRGIPDGYYPEVSLKVTEDFSLEYRARGILADRDFWRRYYQASFDRLRQKRDSLRVNRFDYSSQRRDLFQTIRRNRMLFEGEAKEEFKSFFKELLEEEIGSLVESIESNYRKWIVLNFLGLDEQQKKVLSFMNGLSSNKNTWERLEMQDFVRDQVASMAQSLGDVYGDLSPELRKTIDEISDW